MNNQNYAVRANTPEGSERTDQGTSDRVMAGLIEPTAKDESLEPVGPTDKEVLVEESRRDGKISSEIPKMDVAAHESGSRMHGRSSAAALLNPDESEHFRTLWNEIQGKFVDEPRFTVQHADKLVSEVIAAINQQFSNEQSSLERHWNEGNDASTEDLRQALQQYRAFFNRLVA